MDNLLDDVEVRVLGALIEKDLATPEYYPLTLNALVTACNQKHNREPVVNYDAGTVEAALELLRAKRLAAVITGAGLRVPKYRHLIGEAYNLGRRELAVMCVLLLRGPQTLGELRDRAERMHAFADLEEVESVLQRLAEWQPQSLAARLPRPPGAKEPRYAHLLSGTLSIEAALSAAPAEAIAPGRGDRVAALEAEVAELRAAVEDLRREFADFRRLFQ